MRRWIACEFRCRKCSVLVVVAYFWSGQQMDSEDNARIVNEVHLFASFFKLPLCLMADWNNTPEEVDQHGVFSSLGVSPVVPAGAPHFTCSVGAKGFLDFFVVSPSLLG